MSHHQAFDRAMEVFANAMNAGTRYVDVPAEPDVDVVWSKRDPEWVTGQSWRRWTRSTPRDFPGPSRWSDGTPGFTHTWGSLHCSYRLVRTTHPAERAGNARSGPAAGG